MKRGIMMSTRSDQWLSVIAVTWFLRGPVDTTALALTDLVVLLLVYAGLQINITMPAGQLNGVINNGLGDIILNPGFNTKYTIVTNKGTGRVFGRSITTNQLRIYSLGTGDVFFKGQIKLVNITAQGTGSVTLSGVDKVVGDLTGITNIFVDATSDKAPIQLNAQGISHVYYTQGDCKASSQVRLV
eukprot:GHUV01056950.1.p1 GENE.GHUV01056950.1~~GHUV01056950.1.p1  ORF type:complete len:186 (+),score=50.17 GHUV01056950.1:477-1034(+)